MSNDFDNFYRELRRMIHAEQKESNPLIGVIVETSSNKEYCSVETDNGIISNIPAHGLPVVGDSAIIHFINGNYEQPVCDCARRIPVETSDLEELYTSKCFNWLDNGDFNNGSKGYIYNNAYELPLYQGDSTSETNDYAGMLNLNDEVYIDCDISKCETEYFKFQCCYQGNSALVIGCEDKDTGELIPPLPLNLNQDISIWSSDNGRFGWTFNKEAYVKGDTNEIRIHLKNIYPKEKIPKMQINGSLVEIPTSMLIDSLLVYEENSDINYYNSVQDLINQS
mgnify:CR=1 FL=1